MNIFRSNYSGLHTGLLILRIGIGTLFTMHGLPKVMGGPEKWSMLGQAMSNFGIPGGYPFWGFMGAITELVGGIFLVLGLFFRPVCILLLLTMVVAAVMHLSEHAPFPISSHPIKMVVLFLSLYFIGPGRYSLDYHFGANRELNP